MTDSQKALEKYLIDLNRQAKENGSPFATVTDMDHWANYGITSIEEFERYDEERYGRLWFWTNGK